MAVLEPKLCVLTKRIPAWTSMRSMIVAGASQLPCAARPAHHVVTHYQRLLDYIVPDFVHVLSAGRVVKSGSKQLALDL